MLIIVNRGKPVVNREKPNGYLPKTSEGLMNDTLKQNLVKQLGLDLLPENEQDEAILTIGKIIFEGVILRVMEILDDVDKAALDGLLAGNPSEEAMTSFLRSRVPNLNEIVSQEVATFKEASSGVTRT
jgi:hypothetical protein